MKNLIFKSILFTFFLCIGSNLIAQDKIYKKNNDVVLCSVTEIGEEEVKYTTDATGEVVYVLSVDRIEKIVLENGKELVFHQRMNDPELYASDSKNAFKYGLFSPLTGALNVGYERALLPGRSVEGAIGIIGLGTDNSGYNARGAYLKAGFKFILMPDFTVKGMKYSHQLNGWYFKPEVNLSIYQRDAYQGGWLAPSGNFGRKDVAAGALMLNFGKQMIMSNVFLVDLFLGVGYGVDNNSYDYNPVTGYYEINSPFHYGFVLGEDVPVAFAAGLKIGFLTK